MPASPPRGRPGGVSPRMPSPRSSPRRGPADGCFQNSRPMRIRQRQRLVAGMRQPIGKAASHQHPLPTILAFLAIAALCGGCAGASALSAASVIGSPFGMPVPPAAPAFDGGHFIMMRGRVTPHIPERGLNVACFGRTKATTLLPSRWRRIETKNNKAPCCFRKQNDLGRTGSELKKCLE
jgi:hypothetical protein